ncbi:MAG: sigma-70 family RNA polymerase sigma factor [Myxococcales bacterium]|nr:sigma-70 family RNA polymerase sigma factor [Myxococcales bacterium]MCB9702461.1 sigma-70 family RNA polymerase sigma factor [Myxococcales bacterium]
MSPTTTAEFVSLTTPHMPRLFQIGMRLTHQSSDSHDLVQEALTKAWANWGRFNRDGSLGAWLSRILVNTFISRCRHQKVVNTAAARSDLVDHLFDHGRMQAANDPEGEWQRDDLSDEVVAALDTLPDRFREVVELVDLQGLPYRDTAERLHCPVGTVMSRLHRARRMLREQLGDYARGYGLGLAASA